MTLPLLCAQARTALNGGMSPHCLQSLCKLLSTMPEAPHISILLSSCILNSPSMMNHLQCAQHNFRHTLFSFPRMPSPPLSAYQANSYSSFKTQGGNPLLRKHSLTRSPLPTTVNPPSTLTPMSAHVGIYSLRLCQGRVCVPVLCSQPAAVKPSSPPLPTQGSWSPRIVLCHNPSLGQLDLGVEGKEVPSRGSLCSSALSEPLLRDASDAGREGQEPGCWPQLWA